METLTQRLERLRIIQNTELNRIQSIFGKIIKELRHNNIKYKLSRTGVTYKLSVQTKKGWTGKWYFIDIDESVRLNGVFWTLNNFEDENKLVDRLLEIIAEKIVENEL